MGMCQGIEGQRPLDLSIRPLTFGQNSWKIQISRNSVQWWPNGEIWIGRRNPFFMHSKMLAWHLLHSLMFLSPKCSTKLNLKLNEWILDFCLQISNFCKLWPKYITCFWKLFVQNWSQFIRPNWEPSPFASGGLEWPSSYSAFHPLELRSTQQPHQSTFCWA